MKSILSPLVTLLNNISYKAKFLLIGLIAILYISFLVYKNYSTLNEDVIFSQKEVSGAKLLPSVKNLILETQKLRGTTTSYLNGNTSAKEKISTLKSSVDKKLQNLHEDFANTDIKGLSTLVSQIDTDLKSMMESALTLPAKEAFLKYTEIINKQLDLIVLIGNNSNLILDPDLDSFYMMDAVVNKLPNLFENMGRLRGLSSSVLAKGKITENELLVLMEQKSGAIQNVHMIESGFSSAYNANINIKEKLDSQKVKVVDSFNKFSSNIKYHVMSKQDMKSTDIFAQGTSVIEKADKLYGQVLVELNTLLENRVNKLKNNENILMIQSLLFAIFLAFVFLAFYHSINGAVSSAVSQLKEIEKNGDLSKDIVIDTKDELNDIATAYNSLRASIQTTMKDALIAVDSSTNNASKMLEKSEEIDANSKNMSQVISQMAQKGENIKTELESTKELAQNSKEQIVAAYETLQKATESINGLATQVEESSHKEMEMADKINQLSSDANDVKNVLGVINDIAEQTNLLALNAAIEAARAGEHGRGFAVVADEVRQLAERTQKSLSEINATINVIMQNITEASEEMNKNAQGISSMTETSEKVLEEVEWVNTIMHEATKLIEESSKSIEKNAEGVEIMSKDLHETDELSVSSSQKIASISQSSSALAGKVNEIKEKVGAFTL